MPGIGYGTEQKLWAAGIRTWDDLEAEYGRQLSLFPPGQRGRRLDEIEASRQALASGDAEFFAMRLPSREHYRIAATFPEDTVFLDIETSGLSLYYDVITLIGISRADKYACYVAGTKDTAWQRLLKDAKCIVTFNGTLFDLKFFAKFFPDIPLPKAHVDLRFLVRRVLLYGGQKSIEQQLAIKRSLEIADISGLEAALLWYEYKAGSVEAGRKLALYNHADVEGMKLILDEVLKRHVSRMSAFKAPFQLNGQEFSRFPSSIQFSHSHRTRATNEVHIPRYRGRKGPIVNFTDLSKQVSLQHLRVIGIDLTGSKQRPTGWCLLEGRRAQTDLLRTDREIIDAVLKAKPNLVSIDSPLSLPVGRRTVSDRDRGRTRYGITRACERTLKARGVNVYPSLIPSMQQLTKRGMRLAKKLRSMGVPVIESYPGAAQDIMNIPRKRASLDQLKKGLQLFGIHGDFLASEVTHDEVDAITSAVVGLFFWAGKFEPLGNENEDYLIIPDLKKDANDWRQRRVIGVSGPIYAGKTTAARHLEKRGYAYGRYSRVLAAIAEQEGKGADRVTLQEVGDRIHRDKGQRWLCQELLKGFPSDSDIVIDGLRWPEDHAFWVERFGPAYAHLYVEASSELRKKRYIVSGHTAEGFDAAAEHPVERGVLKLKQLAHHMVLNEKSESGFKRNVTKAISNLFWEELTCQ